MQIKKASSKETILPSYIANSLPVQIIILLSIILISILAGSLFLDKAYITYYWQKAKDMLVRQTEEIRNSETYIQRENGLDTLYLDIPFESMQQIKEKRTEAINTGILISTDDDLVNAKATLNNQSSIKIEMRLKGDWVDHIESDKWSYRIHTKGDAQILGMTNFSIQSPDTRQFLYEWAYHQNLISEGILTTRYSFINIVENGDYKGVYAIEESFTTELIESQENRAGVILRFDEDSMWINRANFVEDGEEVYMAAEEQGLFMVTGMPQAEVQIFQSNSVTQNPVLNDEAKAAVSLLKGYQNGSLTAKQVFDVEKMGRFLAITDYWSNNHASFWHNLRFYYNPVTGLLEPIAYDGDTERYPTDPIARIFGGEIYFDNADIRAAYAAEMERITTPDYTDQVISQYSENITPYYNALVNEYGDTLVAYPWEFLKTRSVLLESQIHPTFPIQGGYLISDTIGHEQLILRVKNLMILPVKILGLEFMIDGENIVLDENSFHYSGDLINQQEKVINYIGAGGDLKSPTTTITIDLTPDQLASLQNADTVEIYVNANISGETKQYHVSLYPDMEAQNIVDRPQFYFENAEANMSQHEFLIKQDEDTLVVQPGYWTVDGDLIIPQQYELIIMPGTTLRFQEGAIFLLGNRLLSKGTESAPVYLTSAENNWAGLVVLNASEQSVVEYTTIENTSSIERDGWILTGGTTFYQSPVRLFYTSFLNHVGEDGLNLIHSQYEMVYVKFNNVAADALDTDFSDGVMENCAFSNVGGDAIDVSGSNTEVRNSRMINITDKAVSAGEKSTVRLYEISIDTANIGIASKDLSSVDADYIDMNHVAYAGFAAYIKKPVFGPGSITANYVNTMDVENLSLVQDGNEVFIDGQKMPTQSLDVDTLYKLGILGN